ncbi:hypothetical protein HMPREF9144_0063 [Prevotella pallens ATCC 700821]|uniref:Uncharacterized protein n=1 Tax=Prevotella pallens ATCC 700821 TaxID=997353 RepID=F9DEH3_9BACT|nr:hypothetical protein HMPREF9144_0063 [Prevotella pallens ATCC 700821]
MKKTFKKNSYSIFYLYFCDVIILYLLSQKKVQNSLYDMGI